MRWDLGPGDIGEEYLQKFHYGKDEEQKEEDYYDKYGRYPWEDRDHHYDEYTQ